MSESDHQAALVRWFSLKYPKMKQFLISYPSGTLLGGRDRYAIGGKLKREGMKAGIPDLFLAIPKNGYGGLWIEMKDAGKTQCSLSEKQKAYLAEFNAIGYRAEWCAGFDAAKAVIEEYLSAG